MRTLTALAASRPKGEWDVIYLEKGKILTKHIGADNDEMLARKLAPFSKGGRQVLLVLRLRKGFFKSKYTATIVRQGQVKNLSWRHNLRVLLRNTYANGEEISTRFDQQLKDADREEMLRTYSISEQYDDAWFVLKEIKENVQNKPVLLLFTSNAKTWYDIRDTYVTPLVDFDEHIKVMGVHLENESPNKLAIQEIFIKFNVRRVPTWIMATPHRKKGKTGVQVTRFDLYRDSYFTKQGARSGKTMSVSNPHDVEEAFASFIQWGVKQVSAFKPTREIDI